jgi:ABC-type antimicrobial peptide transport system permease subunit
MGTGILLERLREAWIELRLNFGRALLQGLGIILGVASVLGGFSISDSQRRRSEELYVRLGGLDKLVVRPVPLPETSRPTALQSANLGLRAEDGSRGRTLDAQAVKGISLQRQATVRVRSESADLERDVTGIDADFLPLGGYALGEGRGFSPMETHEGAPVAVLGTEAAARFFPSGDAVGRRLTVGGIPVQVVGVLQERVFRFSASDHNLFARRNRLIAMPARFVQKRLQADFQQRVDLVAFKVPELGALPRFSQALTSLLKSSHRLQEDFRLDDVSRRVRKAHSQEDVYDLIFLLSGLLALVGGGIVNVNIQMASLRERIHEVGLKMALGASGREIFLGFVTESLLLTGLGSLVGLAAGTAFSWAITRILEIPLAMRPSSFAWAFALAGVTGFLFALYPAWKASRLSPMEALRYE